MINLCLESWWRWNSETFTNLLKNAGKGRTSRGIIVIYPELYHPIDEALPMPSLLLPGSAHCNQRFVIRTDPKNVWWLNSGVFFHPRETYDETGKSPILMGKSSFLIGK